MSTRVTITMYRMIIWLLWIRFGQVSMSSPGDGQMLCFAIAAGLFAGFEDSMRRMLEKA